MAVAEKKVPKFFEIIPMKAENNNVCYLEIYTLNHTLYGSKS